MIDSILDSTKKALGIEAEYDVFDDVIVMHINSVFSTLQQLGVGPIEGYRIQDKEAEWDHFLTTSTTLNNVISYMYLKVRLLFDPPTTSFAIEAMNKQVLEFEWRMNVTAEGEKLNASTT